MSKKISNRKVKRYEDQNNESDDIITKIEKNTTKKWVTNYTIRNLFKLNAVHNSFLELIMYKDTKMVFANGPAGTGKAQPLDADILTPHGWQKMGNIQVNDLVYTADGTTTKVLGVFPQGEKDIYRVCFSDGTSTECCKEHLWLTLFGQIT